MVLRVQLCYTAPRQTETHPLACRRRMGFLHISIVGRWRLPIVAPISGASKAQAHTAPGAGSTMEALYRAVFTSVPDAILVADAESRYLDANPAATALLGYTHAELLQLRVADV